MTNADKKAVLIVDDEEIGVDILADALGDTYDIRVASDGRKALEKVAADPPDLILLDVIMPGLDGYEVCRRLKSHEDAREIPIIFVTSRSEVEDEFTGFALGAADYIAKPINPSIVLARVATHLELKAARDDLRRQYEILRENAKLREDVERITRHDLKSPLEAVIHFPDIIMEDGGLSIEQAEMLELIKAAGYRMLTIVNSSINLFKMESGQYELFPVPVNIIKILFKVTEELTELIRTKGVLVSVHYNGNAVTAADTFIAQGEELLYYSILSNLIRNAVEASPQGSRVTVELEKSRIPTIRIHNLGVVPEEICDQFFEKYTTAGKKYGTGLGTYSARLAIETMGGAIDFRSTEESGTFVTIQLPTE